MIMLELGKVMKDRGIGLNVLAERIGLSNVNLSRIKTNKVKAIRFSTLDAICRELKCQPGDILVYIGGESGAEEDAPVIDAD